MTDAKGIRMHVTDKDLTEAEAESLDRAMYVVGNLPREALLKVVRHLLRAGLVYHRTKNLSILQSAIDSLGTTVRRSSDDMYQKHLQGARSRHERDRRPVTAEDAITALRR
ncbi:hypothetical protein [Kribbella sindirgiensis]|uniref:Uncharacterized protein n=1 Tax=Kribbella sindirgiensis TaxID=1124744 RepID=A0A4R0I5C5_9ACTN|nr:hypothetical protein [Kribbella sindirgiensis]TCC22408.1 hypothetical protein E0H50_35165 [Kribbella sindirgiensis]